MSQVSQSKVYNQPLERNSRSKDSLFKFLNKAKFSHRGLKTMKTRSKIEMKKTGNFEYYCRISPLAQDHH